MTAVPVFRAEWLKLRRRPAVWIMIALLGLVVALFGYVLLYALVTQTPSETTPGLDRVGVLTSLSPANLPGQVASVATGFGAALGVILGALSVGSEFSWRTVTTISIQRPRRATLLAGHIAALLAVCAAMAVTAFVAGVVGSYIVAVAEGLDTAPPGIGRMAVALGVTVLVIGVWCMIGMCLAMVFRGTGWAIGVGLLYTFALEQLLTLLPLPERAGELLEAALIGMNVTALVTSLSPQSAAALGTPPVDIPPEQAVVVLLAYLAVAVAIAMSVFIGRDIT